MVCCDSADNSRKPEAGAAGEAPGGHAEAQEEGTAADRDAVGHGSQASVEAALVRVSGESEGSAGRQSEVGGFRAPTLCLMAASIPCSELSRFPLMALFSAAAITLCKPVMICKADAWVLLFWWR